MKVGSLVVCVRPVSGDPRGEDLIKGNIYTIRGTEDYFNDGELGVYLEEIVNGIYSITGIEFSYKASRFRELLPPIANIEEHINENTLEPELI